MSRISVIPPVGIVPTVGLVREHDPADSGASHPDRRFPMFRTRLTAAVVLTALTSLSRSPLLRAAPSASKPPSPTRSPMRWPTTRPSASMPATAVTSSCSSTTQVEREVARWPDREVRHIHYTGNVYSSADTSRSLVRSGDFNLTLWLDSSGAPYAVTRTGVFEYVEIDGRRVVTHVGRDELRLRDRPDQRHPEGRRRRQPGRVRGAQLSRGAEVDRKVVDRTPVGDGRAVPSTWIQRTSVH